MRLRERRTTAGLGLAVCLLAGCNLPGKPKELVEVPRPDEIMSFQQLYNNNCQSCHGEDGRNGAATNLHNPEYEALIDDASLRDVIANGEKGVLMPAFALSAGGTLTDAQVDVLVRGMRQAWGRPNAFGGATPPLYHATLAGNVTHGQAVYTAACASCHGASAQHPGPSGSILDGSFLGLINDQTIRTTVIAGRPDIGQPDWRGDIPGHALTDAEVTDVTAWVIAQRPAHPGHPYPNMQPNSERPGEAQPLAEKKR